MSRVEKVVFSAMRQEWRSRQLGVIEACAVASGGAPREEGCVGVTLLPYQFGGSVTDRMEG